MNAARSGIATISSSKVERPLPFVGVAGITDVVDEVAGQMRQVLDWMAESRAGCRTSDAALTWLREHAEAAGMLVMISGIVGSNTHRTLDPLEFRGFALVDRYAAVVFVNGADSKAAQGFTLVHELAHLWLGETALSDPDPQSIRTNAVERWCNQVAAEFLVPMAEFRQRFDQHADLRAQLRPLAEHFRVSSQVILGRIREAGALTWDGYLTELDVERQRVAAFLSDRGGGGNYYNTKPVQLSRRFASALIASAKESRTPYTRAFRLLDVKRESTFDGLAERLGVVSGGYTLAAKQEFAAAADSVLPFRMRWQVGTPSSRTSFRRTRPSASRSRTLRRRSGCPTHRRGECSVRSVRCSCWGRCRNPWRRRRISSCRSCSTIAASCVTTGCRRSSTSSSSRTCCS